MPLKNLPIVIREGDAYYKVGKVDVSGSGKDVYAYLWGTKVSRHADGKTYTRRVGSTGGQRYELRIPTTAIATEAVASVPLPSNLTFQAKPFSGDPARAFVFSSTVLSSNGAAIAVEVVKNSLRDDTLARWKAYEGTVSAQTIIDKKLDQSVILTVLHQKSTGGTAR